MPSNALAAPTSYSNRPQPRIAWKVGQLLAIGAVVMRIDRHSERGWHLKNRDDGTEQIHTDHGLSTLYWAGAITQLHAGYDKVSPGRMEVMMSVYGDMPEAARRHAEYKMPYVVAFFKRTRRRRTKKWLEPLIEEVRAKEGHIKGPEWTTLVSWINELNVLGNNEMPLDAHGRPSLLALLPRYHHRGNSKECFHEAAIRVMRETIHKYRMRKEPVSGPEIYLEVKQAVKDLDIDLSDVPAKQLTEDGESLRSPSKRTIQRNMNERVSKEDKSRTQKGDFTADRETLPTGIGVWVRKILERVEIDHTPLDIIVIDPETGTPLGTPWMTTAVDVATGSVVGMYVDLEPPSAQSVLRCLFNAFRPKDDTLALYPTIQGYWPMCGLPDLVVSDNGTDLHSTPVVAACANFGFILQYCPAGQPRFKGHVESFFRGIQKGLIQTLPGTKFSNIQKKGRYDSYGNACLTLDDIRALVTMWIVDYYLITIKDGEVEAPIVRWERGVAQTGIRVPTNASHLADLLTCFEMAKPQTNGVRLLGLRYVSRSQAYREILAYPRKKNEDKLTIRYDSADISTVRLVDPRDPTHRTEVVMECTSSLYCGRRLSYAEHRAVQRIFKVRKIKWNSTTDEQRAQCRRNIEAFVDQKRSQGQQTKKTAKYFPANENANSETPKRKKRKRKGHNKDNRGRTATTVTRKPAPKRTQAAILEISADEFEAFANQNVK